MGKQLLLGAVATATMASVVCADVNVSFENLQVSGFQFVRQGFDESTQQFQTLEGSLSGYAGSFVLNEQGQNFTYCDDLCILIANEDLTEIVAQIGGFSTIAPIKYSWTSGGSDAAGTPGGGAGDVLPEVDVTGYALWIGNGYGGGGIGDWTGDISLQGVELVPAPGALAMLGLAGICARRRRI